MFGRKPNELNSKLDNVANDLLDKMQANANSRSEFAVDLAHLERVRKLRHNDRKRLDPNTMLLVGANLAGIIVLVAWEHAGHVLTSKAQNFLIKP